MSCRAGLRHLVWQPEQELWEDHAQHHHYQKYYNVWNAGTGDVVERDVLWHQALHIEKIDAEGRGQQADNHVDAEQEGEPHRVEPQFDDGGHEYGYGYHDYGDVVHYHAQ